MKRGQLIWNVLFALASGPLLAALLMLVPLAVLTGVSAALDPSLAMYEFIAEEELVIPFVALAALISAANVRLALVMSKDTHTGRIYEVTTDRYLDDPSGAENIHGHHGKRLAEDFIHFLRDREGDAINIGAPEGEDYGWGFWIGEKGFSPLWVAIAHGGESEHMENKEVYICAVTLEPPLMPWRRLTYTPDIALRDRIETHLGDFLTLNRLRFATEVEDWVDPEPKIRPAARF